MTNETYIKKRNLHIPEAERSTNEKFGIEKEKVPYENQRGFRWGKTPVDIRRQWTLTFFRKMDELCLAEGLVERQSV